MTLANPAPELIDKLVTANHILFYQGIVDGFGHISVRHNASLEHFLLSRNRAPGLVTAQDIQVYDLNGDPVKQSTHRSYLERFIHSEIYRARPDVMSIVHNHSQNVIPFGVTGRRLRPIFHMSGFLGSGSALFDTRDTAGNTDLLISNMGLGKALAQALGAQNCVLMRGHGVTISGPSIEVAVYRSIYAETNAKLELQSAALGPVNYLTSQEAALACTTVEAQVVRAWDMWCSLLAVPA